MRGQEKELYMFENNNVSYWLRNTKKMPRKRAADFDQSFLDMVEAPPCLYSRTGGSYKNRQETQKESERLLPHLQ